MYTLELIDRDVRVHLGRADRRVPEQLLDEPQVEPTIEEVRREAVTQLMGMHVAPDGALFVSDDVANAIYRISYAK